MGEAAPSQGGTAERRFRFELAAHPGSVAQARRLTQARLSGWAVCADTCDSAALVISELVTNAIVHTASDRVVCELYDHDDMVRIAVRDEGCAPGEPHPSPQRPDEEHGRGLLLVDALCRAWGAQEHGPGLLVWAELPRRNDAAAPDTAEPRDDLGWGARPKPGRPDDSDDDQPAGASGRVAPEEQRGTAPGQLRHTGPQGRRGTASEQGGDAAWEHHRDAMPEQHRNAASKQGGDATGEQHRGAVPEQHRDAASEHHRGAASGQRKNAASEHHQDAVPVQQRWALEQYGPGGPALYGTGMPGQPGTPGHHGRGEPERHRHLPAGQPLHRLPEQHRYGAAEQHLYAAQPEQFAPQVTRPGAPEQRPHGVPGPHPYGERS